VGVAGHVIISAAVLGAAYAVTRSTAFALAVAGGSLLLDIDHLFDYWLIDRQYSLNPVRFFRYYGDSFPLKRLLFFHSYEVLALLAILAWLTDSPIMGGCTAGALIHLGADILPRSNSGLWQRIKRYSLLYRWHHGFDSSRLYRQD
jgi:hypothetical protein